jgi:hypothetical protein
VRFAQADNDVAHLDDAGGVALVTIVAAVVALAFDVPLGQVGLS